MELIRRRQDKIATAPALAERSLRRPDGNVSAETGARQSVKLVASGLVLLGGFVAVVELVQPALAAAWTGQATVSGRTIGLLALSLVLFHAGLRCVLAGVATDELARAPRLYLCRRGVCAIDYPMAGVAVLAGLLLVVSGFGG
jgi:hypothetical protein